MQDGKKKLLILGQTIAYEGISKKNGKPFKIYEYTCADEHGKAIDLPSGHKFKGFDQLPEGEVIEFEVSKSENEYKGKVYVDWNLRAPRGKAIREPGGLEQLVARVEKLELEVQELKGGTPATSDVPVPAEAPKAAPATSDDDIPF